MDRLLVSLKSTFNVCRLIPVTVSKGYTAPGVSKQPHTIGIQMGCQSLRSCL